MVRSDLYTTMANPYYKSPISLPGSHVARHFVKIFQIRTTEDLIKMLTGPSASKKAIAKTKMPTKRVKKNEAAPPELLALPEWTSQREFCDKGA